MTRDPATTDSLRRLVAQLLSLTEEGALHWERQAGSAHRYARWKNNLLILGPAEPVTDSTVPRYLFITPFDSPSCIEINSDDEELGKAVLTLVAAVDEASKGEPPTDPFTLSDDILSRLVS
jgi:hypothetical protein